MNAFMQALFIPPPIPLPFRLALSYEAPNTPPYSAEKLLAFVGAFKFILVQPGLMNAFVQAGFMNALVQAAFMQSLELKFVHPAFMRRLEFAFKLPFHLAIGPCHAESSFQNDAAAN